MENVTVLKRRGRSSTIEPLSETEVNFQSSPSNTTARTSNLSQTFRKAARQTSQSNFWKAHDQLVETVVEASIEKVFDAETVTDHATQLLSSCRSLVKNEPQNRNALLVACHVLRALSEVDCNPETTARLLYHVVVNSSNNLEICCLGYRALAKLFPTVVSTASSVYFPIPKLSTKQPTSKIPLDQVVSIALFATLAVARAIAVSQNTSYLDTRTKPTYVEVVRELIQNVVVAWTELAQDDEKGNYTKKAFRVLWDLEISDPSQKLLSQKDALVVYSSHPNYFDDACTYAWKISEGYHSKHAPKQTETLLAVHNDLGATLDTRVDEPSLPYVEYCCYRMMHVADFKLPASFDSLCNYTSFVSFFRIAVRIRQNLQRPSPSSDIGEISVPDLQSIEFDVTTCLRLSKLFSALKLHRVNIDSSRQTFLNIAGRVLKCIGNWCLAVATKVDEKHCSSLWTLGLESYKQAISCLNEGKEADETIAELLKRILKKDTAVEYVENCAKFLSALGRRRFDDQQAADAIVPLLYSIKLLLRVAPAVPQESFRDLKLSNRFSMLASIYKSLDENDEVVLATMASLLMTALDHSILSSDSEDEVMTGLIEYLCNLTRDVIYTDSANQVDSAAGMAQSVVKLLSNRERAVPKKKLNDFPSMDPEGIVDILLKTRIRGGLAAASFQSFFDEGFHLAGIAKAILVPPNPTLSFPPGLNTNHFTVATIKILALFVAYSGKYLQGMELSDTDFSVSVLDLKELCEQAGCCLERSFPRNPAFQYLARGTLNTVAATSLLSTSPIVNFERWSIDVVHNQKAYESLPFLDQALMYVDRALRAYSNVLPDSGKWGIAAVSFGAALRLYQSQLSSQSDASWTLVFQPDDLQAAVRLHTQSTEYTLMTNLSRQNLVRHLVRLYALFSLNGENLRAIQVSKWSCDATSVSSPKASARTWFQTMLMSQISNSLNWAKLDDVVGKDECSAGWDQSQLESKACQLRAFAASDSDFFRLQRVLQDSGDEANVLLAWTGTTISLGLSESSGRKGCLPRQLEHLKACFDGCDKLLRLLKRNRGVVSTDDGVESWIHAAVASLPARCIERQIVCLQRIATLYSQAGDRRKAALYAHKTVRAIKSSIAESGRSAPFEMLLKCSRAYPARNCQELRCRRLFLRLKSKEGTLEETAMHFLHFRETYDSALLSVSPVCQIANCKHKNCATEKWNDHHAALDMVNGQVFFPYYDVRHLLGESLREFSDPELSTTLLVSLSDIDSMEMRQDLILRRLYSEEALRRAALAISDVADDKKSKQDLFGGLKALVDSAECSDENRAWAYFLLGTLSLRRARESGDLEALWDSECRRNRGTSFLSRYLIDAKRDFSESLVLLGSSTGALKRSVMRSLALATGPDDSNQIGDFPCWELIMCSMGDDSVMGFNASVTKTILHENQLRAKLLTEWRIVGIACCPTGELLFSSIDNSGEEIEELVYKTACIFPESPYEDCFDEFIRPLTKIIKESEDHLAEAVDLDDVFSREIRQEIKRDWWLKRQSLDEELAQLIQTVESRVLSSEILHQIVVGSSSACTEASFEMSCRDLSSKFAAASVDDTGSEMDQIDAASMTVADLKAELDEYGVSSKEIRKARKSHLVDLILAKRKQQPKKTVDSSPLQSDSDLQVDVFRCTFLILDEHFQRFPFEGMACLKDVAVCRLPSLAFFLCETTLATNISLEFRPDRTSFILDPEANLAGTKRRLLPLLEQWEEDHHANWGRVVGEVPTDDFVQNAIGREDGLLLYFGHGGGQQFTPRRIIEGSVNLSSVILMGCSSGKLQSVNSKNSESLARHTMHYEPEGVARSYLRGGAKCVVANLWDVTDRDIDRFASSFLGSVFDVNTKASIAQHVANARSACKMAFLNGCAPVCYGLPVSQRTIKTKQNNI